MKASLLAAFPRDRRGPDFIGACIAIGALGLFFLANTAAAAPPTTKTAMDRGETHAGAAADDLEDLRHRIDAGDGGEIVGKCALHRGSLSGKTE